MEEEYITLNDDIYEIEELLMEDDIVDVWSKNDFCEIEEDLTWSLGDGIIEL